MYDTFSKFIFIVFLGFVIYILYKNYEKNKKKINSKLRKINNIILNLFIENRNICLVIIFILFLFTRLWLLDQVPLGSHVDETATAYNSFNIANYGVDRYLNPFPLYFLNFGGGQSPMYTYLGAILVKIFGYSLFITRLPAVFFGLLTLVFGYLIGKEIKGDKFGILVAFLITICPYFFMASRWGLDCNLMLGIMTVAVYVLLKAIKTNKISLYVLSGIVFGLVLYSYAISYLIVPMVLLGIMIYLIYIKQMSFKKFIAVALPLVIVGFPMILNFLINAGIISEIRTDFFTIPKMINDRVSEVSCENVFFNFKHIVSYLTFDTLIYNSFPKFGTLYLFSIPMVILGIIVAFYNAIRRIKSKQFDVYVYLCIIFVVIFISILFIKDGYIINKGNCVFICLVIFLGLGLLELMKYFKNLSFIFIIVYLLSFSYFSYYYFKAYPKVYYPQDLFHDNYYEVMDYVDDYDKKIYIDVDYIGSMYIASYLKTSPYDFYKANESTKHFDNIYLYIPKKVDKDSIYCVYENNVDKMKKNGLKCKLIKNYYVCMYEGDTLDDKG